MIDSPVVIRRMSPTLANKGFSQEDVEEYRAVFDYFDIHHTGTVTSKQTATTLRTLKPSPDEKIVQKEVHKINEVQGG